MREWLEVTWFMVVLFVFGLVMVPLVLFLGVVDRKKRVKDETEEY